MSAARDLEKTQQVLLTHGDSVVRVADNFKVIGRSGNLVAAIANDKLRLYGVQFHPEVSDGSLSLSLPPPLSSLLSPLSSPLSSLLFRDLALFLFLSLPLTTHTIAITACDISQCHAHFSQTHYHCGHTAHTYLSFS